MRTKALLSVAAALAVGAITAQAQVYSVNIVGYVNQSNAASAFSLIQNPLDDGAGNRLTNILAGAAANSEAFVWNGAGYTVYNVGAKSGVWSGDQELAPGTGLFIKPAAPFSVTYVGEVIAEPGESVTNVLTAAAFELTGSLLPYATASIATDTNYGLVSAPANTEAYKWTGGGYAVSIVGAKSGVWSPDLGVSVGESIFLKSPPGFDWVQSLPSN
jgi:hypothetical protein